MCTYIIGYCLKQMCTFYKCVNLAQMGCRKKYTFIILAQIGCTQYELILFCANM